MQKLVEVGAGFGLFCEEVLSLDAFEKVVAIEPTPALAKACRSSVVLPARRGPVTIRAGNPLAAFWSSFSSRRGT